MPQININDYIVFQIGAGKRGRKVNPANVDAYVNRNKPSELSFSLGAAWAVHFYRVASELTAEEVNNAGWQPTKKTRAYEGTRKTALLRVSRHKSKPYDFVFVLSPFAKVSKDYPRTEYVLIQEVPARRALVARVPGLFTIFPAPDPQKLTECKDPVVFRSPIHPLVENNGAVAFYANEWDWSWKPRKGPAPEPEYEEPMLENLPPLG